MFIPKQFKNASLDGSNFKLTFTYNKDLVHWVKKQFDIHIWNPEKKCWFIPAQLTNLQHIRNNGFELDESILQWESSLTDKPKGFTTTNHDRQSIEKRLQENGLLIPLRPYQLDGVAFAEKTQGRCLIGDQMGLGKTPQAIAWLLLHKKELETSIALIVCPSSIKINWKREIQKFAGIHSVILQGRKPYAIKKAGCYIINYDILDGWREFLEDVPLFAIICDEVHYTKNIQAKRTKALKLLAKKPKHFLGLSGTPIVNKPIEFFTVLSILDKETFPNQWQYAMRFCAAKNNGYGWDFSGASNTKELHALVTNRLMIRRLKSEVLTELPPKQITINPFELSNDKQYRKEEKFFAVQRETIASLDAIESLKQTIWEGKKESVFEWIEDFLEEDNKLVVFAHHRKTISDLMERFKGIAVKLDGSTSMEDRQKSVDEFQTNPKIKLFFGNLKAAGVGITLTAASNAAFVELGWNPGDHEQAEDRIHRIGQESDSVNIYYLIAENTIEEDILSVIDKKRKILDSVLDGKDSSEDSMLKEILRKIYERRGE